MNTNIKRVFRVSLFAFALMAASAPAHALLLRDFYKLPVVEQGNMCIQKSNELRDKLWSEYDAKGNRKSVKVLNAQREYANFIADLIAVRDERGIRINVIRMHKFVQDDYVINPDGHLEASILKFTRKALEEELAADKARASAAR